MKAARRHALELLEEIGGDVVLEAETESLVASQMTFTLTEAGRALIAKERA